MSNSSKTTTGSTRFLFIGAVALIFVFLSQLPYVNNLASQNNILWMRELIEKLSYALFIGVVSGYVISQWSREKFVEMVQSRIDDSTKEQSQNLQKYNDIAKKTTDDLNVTFEKFNDVAVASIVDVRKEVFRSVFYTLVHKKVYDVFHDTVILCPVVRDNHRIRVELYKEKALNKLHDDSVVRCEISCNFSYISQKINDFDYLFTAGVYTEELPGYEEKCDILGITLAGDNLSREEINSHAYKDGGFLIFKRNVKITQEPCFVSYKTVAYKKIDDSEIFDVLISTTGLDLIVKLSGFSEDMRVVAHALSSRALREIRGGEWQPPTSYHWRLDWATLPHQGVYLSWRRIGSP